MQLGTLIQILVFGLAGAIVLLFIVTGIHFVRSVLLHHTLREQNQTIAALRNHMANNAHLPMPELKEREGFVIIQPDGVADFAVRLESEDERTLRSLALRLQLQQAQKETEGASTSIQPVSQSGSLSSQQQFALDGGSSSSLQGNTSQSEVAATSHTGRNTAGRSLEMAPMDDNRDAVASGSTGAESAQGQPLASEAPSAGSDPSRSAQRHWRNISLSEIESNLPQQRMSRWRQYRSSAYQWLFTPDSRWN